MLKVKTFVFNPFQENTYALYDDESKNAYIIDPGCSSDSEVDSIVKFIEENKLAPQKIINTHCHIDHILGVEALKTKFNIGFYAHNEETALINTAIQQAAIFGLQLNTVPMLDHEIDENTNLSIGNSEIRIFHVPGHSKGSVAIYCPKEKVVFCGDVIFQGSIGRTDLVGGDYDTLINSIKTKILALPDDVKIYSGHGPDTTVGQERKTNPFLLNV